MDVDDVDVVVDDGSDQISERPTVQQLVDQPRLKTALDGLQIFGIGKPPGWRTESRRSRNWLLTCRPDHIGFMLL